MRIFLTGGTGYIGGVLAQRLVADGHEVRALVRATSHRGPLEAAGASLFVGDIRDRITLREGMSGADWVIHAAAEVAMEGSADTFRGANVQGSENVASLASKLGVGRFLSVSSVASFGGSPDDGSAADETMKPRSAPSIYSETKLAGELAIREWAKRGLRVTTVYPSLVYGPPGKKEGANSILRQILLGRMPAIVGGDRKTSWVYIDDLVDGIVRAMERGAVGAGYMLAGEIVTLRGLFEKIQAQGGAPPPRFELPLGVARAPCHSYAAWRKCAAAKHRSPAASSKAWPGIGRFRTRRRSASSIGTRGGWMRGCG